METILQDLSHSCMKESQKKKEGRYRYGNGLWYENSLNSVLCEWLMIILWLLTKWYVLKTFLFFFFFWMSLIFFKLFDYLSKTLQSNIVIYANRLFMLHYESNAQLCYPYIIIVLLWPASCHFWVCS